MASFELCTQFSVVCIAQIDLLQSWFPGYVQPGLAHQTLNTQVVKLVFLWVMVFEAQKFLQLFIQGAQILNSLRPFLLGYRPMWHQRFLTVHGHRLTFR